MDRQRYMAELSKLLAFMFKEDRAEILQHYNELLDCAEDEQALLDEFGSPTKLAVTISRTYDRQERKLAVNADSKDADESSGNTAPSQTEFKSITPVNPKRKSEIEPTLDNAAAIIEEIRREAAEAEGREYIPIFFDEPETEEPAAPEAVEGIEEVGEAEGADTSLFEKGKDPQNSEEDINEPASSEDSSEEAPAESESEDTSSEEDDGEKTLVQTDEPVEETVIEIDNGEEDEVAEIESSNLNAERSFPDYSTDFLFEAENERRASMRLNPFLLILYLIFAIPIGAVLFILLAALTLAVIALAAAVIFCGVKLVTFALSGITVSADIMLIAGTAIVTFAVGLLLLWTGFWLLLAGFSGLIKGIINLGRKFCVKEAKR